MHLHASILERQGHSPGPDPYLQVRTATGQLSQDVDALFELRLGFVEPVLNIGDPVTVRLWFVLTFEVGHVHPPAHP